MVSPRAVADLAVADLAGSVENLSVVSPQPSSDWDDSKILDWGRPSSESVREVEEINVEEMYEDDECWRLLLSGERMKGWGSHRAVLREQWKRERADGNGVKDYARWSMEKEILKWGREAVIHAHSLRERRGEGADETYLKDYAEWRAEKEYERLGCWGRCRLFTYVGN